MTVVNSSITVASARVSMRI